MGKNDLIGLLTGASSDLRFDEFMICLAVALLIGLYIFFIYKVSNTGAVFNAGIAFTILVSTMVTAVIMMIINSNLALSLGMVGALSIIRFRSALKDPRDIVFIFWSVAAGLAAGTRTFHIAIFGTLFIGVVIVVFSQLHKGAKKYLLVVRFGKETDQAALDGLVLSGTKKRHLKMKNYTDTVSEMIYEVIPKQENVDFVRVLSEQAGVVAVNLVSNTENV